MARPLDPSSSLEHKRENTVSSRALPVRPQRTDGDQLQLPPDESQHTPSQAFRPNQPQPQPVGSHFA